MSDVLKDVEAQHANYTKLLGEKQTYLGQVKDNIKHLRQEFKQALSHIAELTGAVNMGSQVIQKLQATQPATTAAPTAPVAIPSPVASTPVADTTEVQE